MTTYTGTQHVEPGLYFNFKKLKLTSIEEPGELPGGTNVIYRRLPLPVMLALAPILALVYVMFLPFVGFAMVAYLLGGKAIEAVSNLAGQTERVRRPAWAPTLAFLSRSKPAQKNAGEPTTDEWSEKTEQKLTKANEQLNATDRDA
jgi:hypothetical protein